MLLDSPPLARLVERNDGSGEEEQQTPDDGQQQRGRLPVPQNFFGVFVLPGTGHLRMLCRVVLLTMLRMVAVVTIFPAFLGKEFLKLVELPADRLPVDLTNLFPVALFVPGFGASQLRQIHVQIS